MTPIHLNVIELKARFEEVYKDPQDAYLFPSFLLSYGAYLLPRVPDIAIPGQDPHLVVAAHLGGVMCQIDQQNRRYAENCYNEGRVRISSKQTSDIGW